MPAGAVGRPRAVGAGLDTRRLRLILLWILLPITLLFSGGDIVYRYFVSLQTISELGIEWSPDSGQVTVTRILEQDPFGRVTPAFRSRLQPNDAIEAIGPVGGPLVPLIGSRDFRRALLGLTPGAPLQIHLARPLPRGGTQPILARLEPNSRRFLWGVSLQQALLSLLIPPLALFTAFCIGFQKPEDRAAFTASLMFLSFATLFVGRVFLLPPGAAEIVTIFHGVFNGFLPFFFMRFFLIFPSPSPLQRRWPWLMPAGAVIGTLSALWTSVSFLGDYYSFRNRILFKPFSTFLDPATSLSALALTLIALASLIANTISAPTKDERRRLTILLSATLTSIVPLMVFLLIINVSQFEPPLWITLFLSALLGLFPLSFIYIIVKHRVLGLSLILRKGIRYALVSKGFLVFEGILIFLALYLFADPLLRLLAPSADQGTLAVASAASTLLAGWGVRSLNRRVLPGIDRRFFRETYNAQQVLLDLAQAIRQLQAKPDRLLQVITDRISESLHPDHVAIFLSSAEPANGSETQALILLPKDRKAAPFRCFRHRMRFGHQDGDVYSEERFFRFVLPPDSHVIRKLAEPIETGDDPKTLDVYLDDPRSWTRVLAPGDAGGSARSAERECLETFNTRLLVPIAHHEQLIGFLSVGEKLSEEPYTREDKQLLLTVAQQSAIAIENAQLVRQVAQQERLQRELEIAQEVQDSLFPQKLPQVPGLDVCGVCRSARGVGGDYYDFVPLGAGRLGIALGDVSGKGISAALLMANLQATLRSHAAFHGEAVAPLVTDVNRMLSASARPGKYATFFYCTIDTAARRLTFVNAGHNPPLLFRTDPPPELSPLPADMAGPEGSLRLFPGGIPIGLFPDAQFEQRTLELQPGDLLVIYTDGVSEAQNRAGEEFGEKRLARIVARNWGKSADAVREAVLADLEAFTSGLEPHDDVTLVIVRIED